jgi:hypothetical protein
MSFIGYFVAADWVMSYDKELGKREVETDVFEQILDAFSAVIGWNLTDDWEGDAEQVEGSPDRIIGRGLSKKRKRSEEKRSLKEAKAPRHGRSASLAASFRSQCRKV